MAKIVVLSTDVSLKPGQREQLLSVLDKHKKPDVEFLLLECGIRVDAVIESNEAPACLRS